MRINTRPSFGRRSACKILMRPDMVVKEAEFTQRDIERIEGVLSACPPTILDHKTLRFFKKYQANQQKNYLIDAIFTE